MRKKDGTKLCPQCKETKSPSEFHKCKQRIDGLKVYCKLCRNKNYLKKQDYFCRKNSEYIARLRKEAFLIVGGANPSCNLREEWNCCVNDDMDYLSLDHIMGDGNIHKKELNTTASSTLYRWAIENPEEAKKRLQILCMNAQIKKKRLFKEQSYGRQQRK